MADQGYEDSRFQNVVNKNFHCPICMNVLKQPIQCRNNEHYFCSPCIRRHLEQNSQSCPLCIEELTIETLRRPSRIAADYLSSLMINCDHADRGCRDVVELGVLESHVADCDFSPVICSNDGCLEVINKKDVEHHETMACGFKKVKCEDCDELFPGTKYNVHVCVLRREMAEMKTNWNDMKVLQEQIMKAVNGISTEVKEQTMEAVNSISTEVKAMREEMKRMITEANNVKQAVHDLSGSNHRTNSRKDIIAVGGTNGKPVPFTERFSWREGKWTPLPQMKEGRAAASAVVFENQILVCGGKNVAGYGTDIIEVMDMNQKPEWLDFPAKLPLKCRGHKCVVYGNRLFVIGGYTNQLQASDGIYEVLLVPPYSSKLLCRMAQKRCYHGVEFIGDKIFIVGGQTSLASIYSCSNVEVYDITKNECKEMLPLPSPVRCMATVGWDDSVILIGGAVYNVVVNTVIAYNIKTGKSKVLPSIKHKREGCAAVVSGNRIVVMGGSNGGKSQGYVESFDFLSHSWIELSSLIEPRYYLTAV